MKNLKISVVSFVIAKLKVISAIALIAIIGLSFTSCGDADGGGGSEKSLIIQNIPANVYAYGLGRGSQIGIFSAGTTPQQALMLTNIVAGAYLSNLDITVNGSGPYSMIIPLYKSDNSGRWTGSGTYDVYVVLTGGGGHYYKASSVRITSTSTTIPFSNATEVFPLNTATVTGVSLNNTTLFLSVGASETLIATVTPSNATNKNVTWSSSNTAVATVSVGTVTAVSAGNAVITVATVEGNRTTICTVTVTGGGGGTIAVTGVSLNKSSTSFTVGNTETLIATIAPSNATNKSVSWNSSAPTVVTVSSSGTVTGVGVGSATIIVSTTDGGKIATCAVTVTSNIISGFNVTGVYLNKTSTTLLVGGTETLVATIEPSNATNQNVTWSSSNTTVATVSTIGLVSGMSTGSAVITVTTADGNKKASCTVTVTGGNNNVAVTGVSLNKTSTTLLVGGTETLTATVTPYNATNQNVSWSSSNTAVATVSNGVVITVSAGSAVITVITADGGKTATCAVTVTGGGGTVAVTGVSLNKTMLSLDIGGTETLTATVSPTNATNKDVIWSSSSNSIVTVSSSGLVTAVSSGSATITVTTLDGFKKTTCNVTVSTTIILTPATLELYISTLHTNTASSPHNITLKVNSNTEFDIIRTALSWSPDKYVKLDLNGSTVTSIGISAFRSCTSLTSVTIPDNVTSIGEGAFSFCSSLASVTIPDSVTSIGSSAFMSCYSLASITIGNNVTSIGNYAFSGTNLTSVTIPDSVTDIGEGAFSGCTSLVSVIIGKGITSINFNTFISCTSLVSITIPDSVTSIGGGAFSRCTSLASVTIGNCVTSIDIGAFSNCTSLASVIIPNSVTSIGDTAFMECTSLTAINVDSGNNAYTSENGILYSKNKEILIKYPSGKIATSFTIPNGVTGIGNNAFDSCTSLASVTIPNSVITIGDYSFSGTSLTSVIIPNGVTSIGTGAFIVCSKLASVIIPDSVTKIMAGAFDRCGSLVNVTFIGTIPSSGFDTYITFIGNLRDKFYETDKTNGTPGTYIRTSGSNTWTRQ